MFDLNSIRSQLNDFLLRKVESTAHHKYRDFTESSSLNEHVNAQIHACDASKPTGTVTDALHDSAATVIASTAVEHHPILPTILSNTTSSHSAPGNHLAFHAILQVALEVITRKTFLLLNNL